MKAQNIPENGINFVCCTGADKHGIFTKKHGRGSEVESDRELNNLVHLPSDLCTSMSHSSDGTVFDVNQLTHSRRAEQKKFTQVMVKVIADGAKPTTCQRCMCVPNDMGAAMSVCKSCSSNAFQFHEVNTVERIKTRTSWRVCPLSDI